MAKAREATPRQSRLLKDSAVRRPVDPLGVAGEVVIVVAIRNTDHTVGLCRRSRDTYPQKCVLVVQRRSDLPVNVLTFPGLGAA